jgi:hypothetical protein
MQFLSCSPEWVVWSMPVFRSRLGKFSCIMLHSQPQAADSWLHIFIDYICCTLVLWRTSQGLRFIIGVKA